MNQSRGSNRPMVVRGNPVPFARQHAPTPSAEGPQPLQWPPAELATRGAAPGQASPAATSTPASCPHSKEAARRSPHRLTVTPGPCCRPRGSGALRDGVQEDRTMGNARNTPLAGRAAALTGGSGYSGGSHPNAANENRTCWRRRQKEGKARRKRLYPSQRHLPAGGRTALSALKEDALAGFFLHRGGRPPAEPGRVFPARASGVPIASLLC